MWDGKWTGKISKNNGFKTEPENLQEQLTLSEAQSNGGTKIMGKMSDPLWKNWEKFEYNHKFLNYEVKMVNGMPRVLPLEHTISIHYFSNPKTGETSGYKFK